MQCCKLLGMARGLWELRSPDGKLQSKDHHAKNVNNAPTSRQKWNKNLVTSVWSPFAEHRHLVTTGASWQIWAELVTLVLARVLRSCKPSRPAAHYRGLPGLLFQCKAVGEKFPQVVRTPRGSYFSRRPFRAETPCPFPLPKKARGGGGCPGRERGGGPRIFPVLDPQECSVSGLKRQFDKWSLFHAPSGGSCTLFSPPARNQNSPQQNVRKNLERPSWDHLWPQGQRRTQQEPTKNVTPLFRTC